MSSLEELDYNRTVLLNDDLAFIELETLQGITSIHLIPKQWGPQAVKEIKDIFDGIRDTLREHNIHQIINMIDPSAKLHKLHIMFGFEKLGTWRELDVYRILC